MWQHIFFPSVTFISIFFINSMASFPKPTSQPTSLPSGQPSISPSFPTSVPSIQPSGNPSSQPRRYPTSQPSNRPRGRPTSQPSRQPSAQPSKRPYSSPSRQPTNRPSAIPFCRPSTRPTAQPSIQPQSHPSCQPSLEPSQQPSSHPSRFHQAEPWVGYKFDINIPSPIFNTSSIPNLIEISTRFSWRLDVNITLVLSVTRIGVPSNKTSLVSLKSNKGFAEIFPRNISFFPGVIHPTQFRVALLNALPGIYAINATILGIYPSLAPIFFPNGNTFNVKPLFVNGPRMQSIKFSSDGTYLIILFSAPTDRGGGFNYFPCSLILSFRGIGASMCQWFSGVELRVYPESGSRCDLQIGEIVYLYGKKLKVEMCQTSPQLCSSRSLFNIFQLLTIAPPDEVIQPRISITMPEIYHGCENFTLSLLGSSGNAGRPWQRIDINIPENTDTIQAYINQRFDSTSLSVDVSPGREFFKSDKSYRFIVTMCNFLGGCASLERVLIVTEISSPSNFILASILGESPRFIYSDSQLLLYAEVALQSCPSGEPLILDSSHAGLVKSYWNVTDVTDSQTDVNGTIIGVFPVKVKSIAADYSKIILSPYQLTVDRSYDISLTVFYKGNKVTAMKRIVVVRGGVVAAIKGGIKQSLSQKMVIDGSVSFDRDVSSGSGLRYKWSCVQMSPKPDSICPFAFSPFISTAKFQLDTLTLVNKIYIDSSPNAIPSISRITLVVTSDDIPSFLPRQDQTYVDIEVVRKTANSALTLLETSADASLRVCNPNNTIIIQVGVQALLTSELARCSWSADDRSVNLPTDADSNKTFYNIRSVGKAYHVVSLIFPPHSLPPRSRLAFTLACDASSLTAVIVTNGPPIPGYFSVGPLSGAAYNTPYFLAASMWSDPDLPLSYIFGAYDGAPNEQQTSRNQMVDSTDFYSLPLVIRKRSESAFARSMLPMGLLHSSFDLEIYVQVFDYLDAFSTKTAFVQVLGDYSPTLASVNATLNSPRITKRNINNNEIAVMAAALNTFVDCSRAPACGSLFRLPCHTVDNTCGECLPNRFGTAGSANSPCLEYAHQYREALQITSHGYSCAADGECAQFSRCNTTSTGLGRCTSRLKECPNSCNGEYAGVCEYRDIGTHRPLSSCASTDATCEAVCRCISGYVGPSCSVLPADLVMRVSFREKLIQSIATAVLNEDLTTAESLLGWSSSLRSASLVPEELSPCAIALGCESIRRILTLTLNSNKNGIKRSDFTSLGDIKVTTLNGTRLPLSGYRIIASAMDNFIRAAIGLNKKPLIFNKKQCSPILSYNRTLQSIPSSEVMSLIALYAEAVTDAMVISQFDFVTIQSTFRVIVRTLSSRPTKTFEVQSPVSVMESLNWKSILPTEISFNLSASTVSSGKITLTKIAPKLFNSISDYGVNFNFYHIPSNRLLAAPLLIHLSLAYSTKVDEVLVRLPSVMPELFGYIRGSNATFFTNCRPKDIGIVYNHTCPYTKRVLSHLCTEIGLLKSTCPASYQITECALYNSDGNLTPSSDTASSSQGISSEDVITGARYRSLTECRLKLTSYTASTSMTSAVVYLGIVPHYIEVGGSKQFTPAGVKPIPPDFVGSYLVYIFLGIFTFIVGFVPGIRLWKRIYNNSYIFRVRDLRRPANSNVANSLVARTSTRLRGGQSIIPVNVDPKALMRRYFEGLVPVCFRDEESSLLKLLYEFSIHHTYLLLFFIKGASHNRRYSKYTIAAEIFTKMVVSMTFFTILYELETPVDDRNCMNLYEKAVCLSYRPNVFDSLTTYCTWDDNNPRSYYSAVNISSASLGRNTNSSAAFEFIPSCTFNEHSISPWLGVYLSTWTLAIMAVMVYPIEALITMACAPVGTVPPSDVDLDNGESENENPGERRKGRKSRFNKTKAEDEVDEGNDHENENENENDSRTEAAVERPSIPCVGYVWKRIVNSIRFMVHPHPGDGAFIPDDPGKLYDVEAAQSTHQSHATAMAIATPFPTTYYSDYVEFEEDPDEGHLEWSIVRVLPKSRRREERALTREDVIAFVESVGKRQRFRRRAANAIRAELMRKQPNATDTDNDANTANAAADGGSNIAGGDGDGAGEFALMMSLYEDPDALLAKLREELSAQQLWFASNRSQLPSNGSDGLTSDHVKALFNIYWFLNDDGSFEATSDTEERKKIMGNSSTFPLSSDFTAATIKGLLKSVQTEFELHHATLKPLTLPIPQLKPQMARLVEQRSRRLIGVEIFYQFVCDLLGGKSLSGAALIFADKCNADCQLLRALPNRNRIFAMIGLAIVNGVLLWYIIQLAMRRSESWHQTFVLWGSFIVCNDPLYVTIQCVWLHFINPLLVFREVQAARQIVSEIVNECYESDHQDHAASADLPENVLRNFGSDAAVIVDAPSYFFASHRLAQQPQYDYLLESNLVLAYNSCHPGMQAQAWNNNGVLRSNVDGIDRPSLCLTDLKSLPFNRRLAERQRSKSRRSGGDDAAANGNGSGNGEGNDGTGGESPAAAAAAGPDQTADDNEAYFGKYNVFDDLKATLRRNISSTPFAAQLLILRTLLPLLSLCIGLLLIGLAQGVIAVIVLFTLFLFVGIVYFVWSFEVVQHAREALKKYSEENADAFAVQMTRITIALMFIVTVVLGYIFIFYSKGSPLSISSTSVISVIVVFFLVLYAYRQFFSARSDVGFVNDTNWFTVFLMVLFAASLSFIFIFVSNAAPVAIVAVSVLGVIVVLALLLCICKRYFSTRSRTGFDMESNQNYDLEGIDESRLESMPRYHGDDPNYVNQRIESGPQVEKELVYRFSSSSESSNDSKKKVKVLMPKQLQERVLAVAGKNLHQRDRSGSDSSEGDRAQPQLRGPALVPANPTKSQRDDGDGNGDDSDGSVQIPIKGPVALASSDENSD